ACHYPKRRPARLVPRGGRGGRFEGDSPTQSASLAFPRRAGQIGTVERSIEQRTQENLRCDAAFGVGHNSACLRQVWTNYACESQNQRQSDERFEQRKSRLPTAPVITVRSQR